MLQRSSEGAIALAIVHGAATPDNNAGQIGLYISDHSGIRLDAWDGEAGDTIDMSDGEFKWSWNGCCTDGIALELHEETECVTMQFIEGSGVEGVDVITNEDGDRSPLNDPFAPVTVCLPESCDPEVPDAAEEDTVMGSAQSPPGGPSDEGNPADEEPQEAVKTESTPPGVETTSDPEEETSDAPEEGANDAPEEETSDAPEEGASDAPEEGTSDAPSPEAAAGEGDDEPQTAEGLNEMEDESAQAEETSEDEGGAMITEGSVERITSQADYDTIADDLEQFVEDFEYFAGGVEVHGAKSGFIPEDGFMYADQVTFNSWPASVLTEDEDPDEPVVAGVQVAGDSAKWQSAFTYYECEYESGDAAILATIGENMTSGYEAIQANFTTPVRSVAFHVSLNRFGYIVDVFVEGQDEPAESFIIDAFETLVIGAHLTDDDSPGITAMRVTPRAHGLGGYGVWWWSVWSVSFAL